MAYIALCVCVCGGGGGGGGGGMYSPVCVFNYLTNKEKSN